VGTSGADAATAPTPTSAPSPATQTATGIAVASQPAVTPSPTVPLRRTVLTAVPYAEPAHPAPLALPAGCTILVTDEGTAFTRELSKGLTQKGYKVVKLDLQAPESWVFPADTHALLVLGAPPKRQRKAPLWGAEHEEALINGFFAVQKAGPILRNNVTRGPVLLATVARLDGGFGLLDLAGPADPCQGGLAGLAKTAAREWTELTVRAFDLAPALEAPAAVRALLPQLFRAGPIELGITADGLYHLQEAMDRPPAPPDPNPLFQPGEVVLVTGGARGVTAEISVALARTWRPTILLLGRTPAPQPEPAWLAGVEGEAAIKQAILRHAGSAAMKPRELEAEYRARLASREILATLQRIEAAGGRPLYRSVDVRDEKAVHTVVASIEAEVGPIVGLVHGAGVLRDRRIEDKTRDQLEDVLRTKITSLRHLLAALDPARLRLLGLFSSTTARLGRIGQVDYAMANEALNKIAQKWSRFYPACRTVSFNWGPWEGGMVTDSLKKLFRAEGVGLIPLAAGAELFIREIAATGQPPVEVGVVALEGTTTTGPGPDRSAPTSQASLTAESPSKPTTTATPAPQVAPTVVPASRTTTATAAPAGPARRFRLAFERDLDLDRERYLAHHILNGEPVFPVAMMVEWMAHAAIHENPGLQFHGFDDLKVLKGIVLAGGRPTPISVHATKIRPGPHGLCCSVEIRGTPGGREVVHASAEVVLADRLPAAPDSRVRPDISRPYPLPIAEIYRQHLFHGTMLQGIHRVQGWSPEGIVAESGTTPPPAAWVRDPLRPAWLSDPLALDVAFQLMILWTTQVGGAPSLPTAAARYRQYQASFPSDRVSVRIAARLAGSYKAQADIDFVDAQGGLVAVLEGYECMMNPSLHEAFGRRTLERHVSA
jgi:NAD(P)-dependent dehydrogenase (short-subunit alcohol dehydrogenase family)